MDKKKYEKTRAFFFSTTQVTSSKKLDQRDPRKGKKSNFFVIANRTLFTSFFLFLFIYFLWSTLISSKSVVGLMKEEGMDGKKFHCLVYVKDDGRKWDQIYFILLLILVFLPLQLGCTWWNQTFWITNYHIDLINYP